ncbi:tRNA (guanosine(46)-N7)-methyltransferase TrmB [Kaustia mangrovi]|nr:tRNA (guanosine(46)-N7)-methyltransferase TrmB [Kaustia mangrovi]
MTTKAQAAPGERSRGQLFGRRKGHRLRPRQLRLVEEMLPGLRVCLDGLRAHGPAALFDRPVREVWLEIGFGGGEHLAWQAAHNRDIGMIGAEPFVNGVAKLLAAIEDEGLGNIRIHDDDARPLLEALPDNSLDRVFVLFPDPWPKARHRKRRFVSHETVGELHRILRPGGTLRFASDIADYVRWTLAHIRAHGGFEWTAEHPRDWRERPRDWPGTRYEAKARGAGRRCAYLSFRRA